MKIPAFIFTAFEKQIFELFRNDIRKMKGQYKKKNTYDYDWLHDSVINQSVDASALPALHHVDNTNTLMLFSGCLDNQASLIIPCMYVYTLPLVI